MSDNHDYLNTGLDDKTLRLSGQVTFLMLRGAGYAMVFCLAVWFLIWATITIGEWLPEESRETEDPTPFSQMEIQPSALRLV